MNTKTFMRWGLALVLPLGLAGCLDTDTTPKPSESVADVMQQSAMEHGLKHQNDKYVCPMHPQIVREEEGTCPICGMDLVKVDGGDKQPAGKPKLLYYRHPMNPEIHSDVPMKDDMGMDYIPVYEERADVAPREPLYYRHPMDPSITSDVPMKDDMGMDYIPIHEEGGASVTIDPVVVNNMGVRTATAEVTRLWRRIDTVASVGLDENKVSQINLRTDGWIEQLAVKSEGERVKRGDVLFSLYSPTLVNAQEEYLQALSAKHARLIEASRERLRALGVSQGQIKALERNRKVQHRLRIYAPQDGIVANLNVREGQYVKPATAVMTLADLSSVWLIADVFERQADWVRVGAPAEVRLAYLPGRVWEGDVAFIHPSLDPKSRTLKVRLRFDNADESLKPNMFAKATIFGGAKNNVVAIPREALIRTGNQDRVVLARGDGRYTPRKVTVGIETGDWVEILDGLRAGDTVVTSGQFLIDSEASLKASILRLDGGAGKLVAGPKAVSMAMPGNTPAMTSAEALLTATARVIAVMPDEQRITLDHDPIPAIGWPAMKMPFAVDTGVDMSNLAAGDRIAFDLVRDGEAYRVSSIRKLTAE